MLLPTLLLLLYWWCCCRHRLWRRWRQRRQRQPYYYKIYVYIRSIALNERITGSSVISLHLFTHVFVVCYNVLRTLTLFSSLCLCLFFSLSFSFCLFISLFTVARFRSHCVCVFVFSSFILFYSIWYLFFVCVLLFLCVLSLFLPFCLSSIRINLHFIQHCSAINRNDWLWLYIRYI